MLTYEQFERVVLRTRTYLEFKVGRPVVAERNPDDPLSRGHMSHLLVESLRFFRTGDVGQANHLLGLVQGVLLARGEVTTHELHLFGA